jgi:hypothetical protein
VSLLSNHNLFSIHYSHGAIPEDHLVHALHEQGLHRQAYAHEKTDVEVVDIAPDSPAVDIIINRCRHLSNTLRQFGCKITTKPLEIKELVLANTTTYLWQFLPV